MTTEQRQRILELWQGWTLQGTNASQDDGLDPTLKFWGQVVQGDLGLLSVGLGDVQTLLQRELGG